MKVYLVRVYRSGMEISRMSKGGRELEYPFVVEAEDAAEAMDEVEQDRMGLKPPQMSINHSTGKMSVTGWHGYEFVAQAIA